MKIKHNKDWYMHGLVNFDTIIYPPKYTFIAESEEEELLLLCPQEAKDFSKLLNDLSTKSFACLEWDGIPTKYHEKITSIVHKAKKKLDDSHKVKAKVITDKYKKIREDKKAAELVEKKAFEEKEKIKEAVREVLDEREKDNEGKQPEAPLLDPMIISEKQKIPKEELDPDSLTEC